MYHLINLENQTRKSFETRIDLLAHWRFQLRHDSRFSSITTPPLNFNNLNVTGKDVYASEISGPWIRCFQVLDEEGRSQDIRIWKKEIEAVNDMEHFPWRYPDYTAPRFRREPAVMGRKRLYRKGRYNSFTKQKLRDKKGSMPLDFEDDLLGFTPITDHSRPRTKERRPHKPNLDFQSWKSSTKNFSQWGRHLDRVTERPIRKSFPADYDEGELMLKFERSVLQELCLEAQMEEDMAC